MKLVNSFREVAKPEVQCGNSILFWSDEWEVDHSRIPLMVRFARLFSFAKDDKLSVQEAVSLPEFIQAFHLPLSTRAYDEFLLLDNWLHDLQLSDIPDV